MITADHDVWLFRRLVRCLDAWYMARLFFTRCAINPFGITFDAHFQRAGDENFRKMRYALPRTLSIGSPIRSGVEDNGYSVLGEDPADECQRTIKIFAVSFVVRRCSREQFPQRVRFKDGELDAEPS